jgi:F-type H+-transporting ATPase subunit b
MLDFSVTFFITIVNITVLFFILRAILWKPVTKFMAERAERIRDSIAQSENDKARAKALLAQYEAQLKTAEAEAQAIISKAREQAEAEAEKIIAESRASVDESLVNAKKQLEAERKAALEAFRKEAASLVVTAAGRLVGREIKSEDNSLYAAMLLNEAAALNEADED